MAVIGSEDDFVDVILLIGAAYSAQAVGRIEIPEGRPMGTGFLVGPDLLLTNHNVLNNKEALEEAVVRFKYMNDDIGIVASPGNVVNIRADLYFASPPVELDYALVRLEEIPLRKNIPKDKIDFEGLSPAAMFQMGIHKGYLELSPRYIQHQDRVNIIQHPNGDPLKVVMTNNHVAGDMTSTRVHYVASTKGGSGGAPVFNRQWEVIALHHAGKPYPSLPSSHELPSAEKDWRGRYRVNEGIPMRAILADMEAKGIKRFLPRY